MTLTTNLGLCPHFLAPARGGASVAEAGWYRLLRVSETGLTVALALFCPRRPPPAVTPGGLFQRADLFMPGPGPASDVQQAWDWGEE